VCVHTSGEVDSFNTHGLALIAASTCQIWWKFLNNFKVIAKKTFGVLQFCAFRDYIFVLINYMIRVHDGPTAPKTWMTRMAIILIANALHAAWRVYNVHPAVTYTFAQPQMVLTAIRNAVWFKNVSCTERASRLFISPAQAISKYYTKDLWGGQIAQKIGQLNNYTEIQVYVMLLKHIKGMHYYLKCSDVVFGMHLCKHVASLVTNSLHSGQFWARLTASVHMSL